MTRSRKPSRVAALSAIPVLLLSLSAAAQQTTGTSGTAGSDANKPAATAPSGNAPATPPSGNASATPPASSASGSTSGSPAVTTEGRLQESHGGWRSSRLVGADVYGDDDKDIGTIDDIIVGKADAKADTVVISVGGFLGIGSKLVAVSYDKLKFEEHVTTSGGGSSSAGMTGAGASPGTNPGAGAASGPGPAAGGGGGASPPATSPPAASATPATASKTIRIVLPGATADSLKSMEEFKYQP